MKGGRNLKEFLRKFKIVFKRVMIWEKKGVCFLLGNILRNKGKISVVFFLALLALSLLGSVRHSFINNLQVDFFRSLNLPLEHIYLSGYRLVFAPYFIINLALMAVSVSALFSFYAAKTRPRAQFWNSFVQGTAIISVFVMHTALVTLFFKEKAFNAQLILYFAECMILLGIFFMRDWNRGINIKVDKYLNVRETGFLFLFTAGLFALYMFDYASWKYSYIGDEYAFYKFAGEIFDGGRPLKFFYEQGVYGDHPNLASIYTAFIMKLSGAGLFSWKFSSAVIPVITAPLLYIWVKLMFNKKTAAIAAVVFGFSLSMLAFAKIPYDNMQAVFVFVLSMLLVEIAIRKNSSFWALLAGISLGLGCYTYYTARLTVIAAGIYWLFHPLRKNFSGKNLAAGLLVYLGTIMFLFMNPDFLNNLLARSTILGSQLNNPAEKPLFIFINYIHTFFAFIYKANNTHYITGSVADKITAAGAVFGMAWAVFSFSRDWRARFLITTYPVLVFFVGGIVEYKYPVNTRIIYLIPLLSVIAAAGLHRIINVIILNFKSGRSRPGIVFGAVLVFIAFLNIYGFYFRMPSVYSFKMQSYLVKYMRNEAPEKKYVLAAKEHVNMPLISKLYGFSDKLRKIEVAEFEDMLKNNELRGKILVMGARAAREKEWPAGFRGRVKEIRDHKGEPVYYIFDIPDSG